jgi:hypothetical protein
MVELKPIFDFCANESCILHHDLPAEVCINKNTYKGTGNVRLELFPRATICFLGNFHGVIARDALDCLFGEADISFSFNNRQVDGFLMDSSGDIDSQEYNVKWIPNHKLSVGIGGHDTEISEIIFHLFNFVDFIGTRRSIEQDKLLSHAIEHIDLFCDQWNVEIKSLISTRENIKKLKEAGGGYCLTHVVSLKKINGAVFTGNNAEEILNALRFFLTFAKGCWCDPACAVGFDSSGDRVWESWLSPEISWQSPLSWFDHHHSTQLTYLFPGFMNRWKDDDWRVALKEVIYWYQNANNSSRGIDAGIILMQAAIERLSFEYVVKDKRLLSVNGFKDLRASDKIRILFSSLGLPLEIPEETPEIKKISKELKWESAPHALTEIRNSLVHPEYKRKNKLDSAYYEAWNLGLWYLELALLAICDYSGDYGNRIKQKWVGEVEVVPWAKDVVFGEDGGRSDNLNENR